MLWGGGRDAGVLQLLEEEHLTAKMHLVDLAGSERIKRTKAEGVRMQEGERADQKYHILHVGVHRSWGDR